MNHYNIDGDQTLTDRAKEVMKNVCDFVMSYNFDDIDPMTDYFCTNFYLTLGVETYKKPYKVELHERYRWVIRWREAKLLCQYPKKNKHRFQLLAIQTYLCQSQITIAERKEQEFLQYQRQNNLFFDEQTDEQLIKFRKKLSKKRQQYTELITKIYKEAKRHKASK